jgi:nucleotide-binding universal stress UspA family protein
MIGYLVGQSRQNGLPDRQVATRVGTCGDRRRAVRPAYRGRPALPLPTDTAEAARSRGKGQAMRTPPGAVVVGVEEGADASRAVRWAAAEAESLPAPLHLVHALQIGYREFPATPGEYRWFRRRADRVISAAREAVGGSFSGSLSSEIIDQDAAPALVAASAEARLTVVGSHGHSIGFELLVGSVSLHLAHHASSPVVVVREQADPAARRIVVGVDGSADSEAAIGFAFDVASRHALPLTALHGWAERFQEVGDLGGRINAHDGLLRAALVPWTAKYPEVALTAEAAAVHPSRLLVDASAHAGLLVVGARGRTAFAGMRLGSVGQAALHHAHCPVVIAR